MERSRLVGGVAVTTSLMMGVTAPEAIGRGPNGRIVFESNRTGNNEIFTMNFDFRPDRGTAAPPAAATRPARRRGRCLPGGGASGRWWSRTAGG